MKNQTQQLVQADRYQVDFNARYFVDLADRFGGIKPNLAGEEQDIVRAMACLIRQRQEIITDMIAGINGVLRRAVAQLNNTMDSEENKLLVGTLEVMVNKLIKQRAKAKVAELADLERYTKDMMIFSEKVSF